MRFLADENVPRALVAALSAPGHDVVWVREVAPGSRDEEVLARAAREGRILVTFDKDFGELAARTTLVHSIGIVLLRLPLDRPTDLGRRIAALILDRDDWIGHFSVIEPGRVRMRPLSNPT